MVGKAALLLVMGFSIIFLAFGDRFASVSNQSVQNYSDYFTKTIAHNIASSGANLAANAVFQDDGWTTGFTGIPFNGGEISSSIEILDPDQNIRKITSIAAFNGIEDTVEVILSPSRFSKFAYYSKDEGGEIWWTGKDTVWGPFHTQDDLLADNHPVFGVTGYRTTIKGKIVYHDYYQSYGINEPTQRSSRSQKNAFNQSIANDKPIFHGSFEAGIDDPLPDNGLQPLRDEATENGKLFNLTSTSILRYQSFYLTFINDQVTYKILGQKKVSGSWVNFDTTNTVDINTLSPNGIIYLDGVDMDGHALDIHLKGTVQGSYSVVSDGSIYLDDDIVYNTDPRTNPGSTDLLGIVAQKNVWIKDDDATKNIKIDAAIYCQEGGFGADNYEDRSIDGNINLYGGITQNIRRAVGTYNSSTGNPVSGFMKRYRYDKRLLEMFPPSFPICSGFSIVSWKE